MARLLRLLPDPACAHEPGGVDSPKITLVSLAAVAERAQPLQRTAPSWRTKVPCSGRRRFADGVSGAVTLMRRGEGPLTTLKRRSGPRQPMLGAAESGYFILDFHQLTAARRAASLALF